MSTILQKILLMGWTGLMTLPATMGLGWNASVVDAHLPTPTAPFLLAVNRTERAWFDAQRSGGDLRSDAKGISEPVLSKALPFSIPLQWPPQQAEEVKVAVLSSVQGRLSPPRVRTRSNRDARRKRLVG
jgi:hypothetical protein